MPGPGGAYSGGRGGKPTFPDVVRHRSTMIDLMNPWFMRGKAPIFREIARLIVGTDIAKTHSYWEPCGLSQKGKDKTKEGTKVKNVLGRISIAAFLMVGMMLTAEVLLAQDIQGDHSMLSFNYPDRYIRHQNFLGELTPVISELDRKDSTFKIVPGLANASAISLESVNYPGYYLRHQGFRIKLQKNDGSDLFKKDATFVVESPNASGASANWVSFRSVNYPDRYIRHRSFHLYLESGQTELFNQDSTFAIVNPNWPCKN